MHIAEIGYTKADFKLSLYSFRCVLIIFNFDFAVQELPHLVIN